jgi:hypothetical protein
LEFVWNLPARNALACEAGGVLVIWNLTKVRIPTLFREIFKASENLF